MSRTSKSLKNIIIAWISQILLTLIGFIARKVFIVFLNAEYLGVNGLFTSIITVLSLAELGLGPAMVFSLYKPLAEKDDSLCATLMKLYQKAYRIIGLVVLAAGICITPFLSFFIKDIPEGLDNISIIYIMFVVNTAISYFYAYKRLAITASQNQYIIDSVHTIARIIMNIVQIIVLACTRNYLLFLTIQLITTMGENIILSRWADKSFTWLRSGKLTLLPAEKKSEITHNVGAMIFHRVGGIVVDTIDNLLISKYFGLLFLGIYSNYLLVINGINSFIKPIFSGVVASIGDFGVQKDENEKYKLYKIIQFINFWIVSLCTVCLYCLIDQFVGQVWLNKDFVLDFPIKIVIVINFYIAGMRNTVLTFKEALGLPWYDRYKPLLAAAANLIFSVILARTLGVIGVFLGTTITQLGVNVWYEALVLFKHGFGKNLLPFISLYVEQFVVMILITVLTVTLTGIIDLSGIIGFLVNIAVCLIVPNIIMAALFFKKREFRYIMQLAGRIIKKMINRR